MVSFDAALLSWLASSFDGEDALVPLDADGRPQPLHAVYATAAAPSLRAALDHGQRSMRDGLARLNVRYVSPEGFAQGWSRNLNRPSDLP
jgi:molybdopterin-guanine dinucleotide biosynthesis protein A